MFKFLFIKKINKVVIFVLNSKITYIFLILIILIQFILVSIIFFQNKKCRYLIEQANFQTSASLNQTKQLNERINSLQSYIMRLSSQIYRLQGENENNN